MYTAFILGSIASGKSTATRYLERRGARRIDLDDLAKSLYVPESSLLAALAEEFGWDILDSEGCLRSPVLASRAFATPEATNRLNAIVHPAVRERLSDILLPVPCCSVSLPRYPLTVVEISAPQGFSDMFPLADETLLIDAPLSVRRERAHQRGMNLADFDARAAVQPSDAELRAMADTVISNTGSNADLFALLDGWARSRGIDLSEEGATGGAV